MEVLRGVLPEVPNEPFDVGFRTAPERRAIRSHGPRRIEPVCDRFGLGRARCGDGALGGFFVAAGGGAGGGTHPPAEARPADRWLRAHREHRRGGHGGGLSRPGHPPRTDGRVEAPAARAGRRPRGGPEVLSGRARRGAARPREYRPRLHDRLRRGLSFHRLRIHRRDHDPPARRAGRRPSGRRGDQLHAPDRQRPGPCQRARGGASRRQALEHHHHAVRAGRSWSTWAWLAGSSATATTG